MNNGVRRMDDIDSNTKSCDLCCVWLALTQCYESISVCLVYAKPFANRTQNDRNGQTKICIHNCE